MAHSIFRRFGLCETGNVAVISALAAVPLLGTAGVAIDYVRSNNINTQVRAALDSAVLAGAAAPSNQAKVAEQYFASNFPVPNVTLESVKFVKSGNVKVEGRAKLTVTTSLAGVLGIKSISLDLESAAISSPAVTGLCILALSPNESQSLLANSGADVKAPACEIHVKSTANPAAIFNAATTIAAKKTCIQGSHIINNGGSVSNLQTGCSTLADPYAGKIPAPASTACDYNNMNFSGNVTLDPGVYCGWHNFNSGSNVILKPGTYVIKSGGWNVNGGTWTGTGITFYYADTSKIQFNSAVKADLKAPTNGIYKNILMAETEGLSASQFIFDDNLGFAMTGVLHLPSREVVFNSGTTTRSYQMTAIMRKAIFNGTRWTITPAGGSSGGGAQVRLIE
jgi:hypothetical protein